MVIGPSKCSAATSEIFGNRSERSNFTRWRLTLMPVSACCKLRLFCAASSCQLASLSV